MPEELDSLAGDADVYEVVFAFDRALESRPGDHTLLKQWAARFPQYEQDLTATGYARFAFGLSLTDAVPDGWEGGPAPAPDRGPLVSLVDEAKAQGLDAAQFARALRLDKVLLARLSQRLLDAATLPRALVALVARTIDRPFEDVAAYLRQGPRLAAAGHYKARRAPSLIAESMPQETFADAVRGSRDVPETDRAFWLEEMADGETLGYE